MFSEAGIEAILQFGALGVLAAFMFLSHRSGNRRTEFQQEMTIRVINVIEKNTAAHEQAKLESQAICKGIEDNRSMEKEEHKALMDQHKTLMNDHKHITRKLSA
jgi:hypothetical protein